MTEVESIFCAIRELRKDTLDSIARVERKIPRGEYKETLDALARLEKRMVPRGEYAERIAAIEHRMAVIESSRSKALTGLIYPALAAFIAAGGMYLLTVKG